MSSCGKWGNNSTYSFGVPTPLSYDVNMLYVSMLCVKHRQQGPAHGSHHRHDGYSSNTTLQGNSGPWASCLECSPSQPYHLSRECGGDQPWGQRDPSVMAPPHPLNRDTTVDNFHARDRFPITQEYNGQNHVSSQNEELCRWNW